MKQPAPSGAPNATVSALERAFARDEQGLYFVPLGGSGEIGMNLNLYAYRDQWLMLDCGVTFGEEEHAGVDVIMPDPAFIVERKDKLLGIVAEEGDDLGLALRADRGDHVEAAIAVHVDGGEAVAARRQAAVGLSREDHRP